MFHFLVFIDFDCVFSFKDMVASLKSFSSGSSSMALSNMVSKLAAVRVHALGLEGLAVNKVFE